MSDDSDTQISELVDCALTKGANKITFGEIRAALGPGSKKTPANSGLSAED